MPSVDYFASDNNKQLPKFYSQWWCPGTSGVDCLSLSDALWRQELNWCNPPWELLQQLVDKLHNSGAAALVVAPYWPEQPWWPELCAMANDSQSFPPEQELFWSGRGGLCAGARATPWPIRVFNIPLRHRLG
jgi:hypothetical protein